MKLYSWNVNGIRAAVRKGFLDWLAAEQPDIVCVQETKAWPEQLSEEIRNPNGYRAYWAGGERKGYSGVGLITKAAPLDVQFGLGLPEFGDTILDGFGVPARDVAAPGAPAPLGPVTRPMSKSANPAAIGAPETVRTIQ